MSTKTVHCSVFMWVSDLCSVPLWYLEWGQGCALRFYHVLMSKAQSGIAKHLRVDVTCTMEDEEQELVRELAFWREVGQIFAGANSGTALFPDQEEGQNGWLETEWATSDYFLSEDCRQEAGLAPSIQSTIYIREIYSQKISAPDRVNNKKLNEKEYYYQSKIIKKAVFAFQILNNELAASGTPVSPGLSLRLFGMKRNRSPVNWKYFQ